MTSYHHGNLHEELIRTGVQLARESGPSGVVLREVARRAGVSHNAAYRHFADRDELLSEVALVGLQELAAAMSARVARLRGRDVRRRSLRRLRELGQAYVMYAVDQPGLFATAFAATPDSDHGETPGPYAMLGAALDEMVATGAMASDRRAGAEVECWSAVHGFALLHIDGPLRVVPPPERDRHLELMLDTILVGLTAAPAAP